MEISFTLGLVPGEVSSEQNRRSANQEIFRIEAKNIPSFVEKAKAKLAETFGEDIQEARCNFLETWKCPGDYRGAVVREEGAIQEALSDLLAFEKKSGRIRRLVLDLGAGTEISCFANRSMEILFD